MILSKIAILALRGTSNEFKIRLMDSLGAKKTAFYRWIDENKKNGPLTTYSAINAMAQEFGLPADTDILLENSDK